MADNVVKVHIMASVAQYRESMAGKKGSPQYARLLKICARYDNVWSYTNKVIEVYRVIAK